MIPKKVDLKDFIRNFVNSIPKNRDRSKPLICLEFPGREPDTFDSRIVIQRIESLNIVWYRYVRELSILDHLSNWHVEEKDWIVLRVLPPVGDTRRHLVSSEESYKDLAVIQVGHFRE